jgi:hypothetical protein
MDNALLCHQGQRQNINLLLARGSGPVEAWLTEHREIINISLDCGGGYGQAAKKASLQAVQIADRASGPWLTARPIRAGSGDLFFAVVQVWPSPQTSVKTHQKSA